MHRNKKIAGVLRKEIAPLLIEKYDQNKFGLITIVEIVVNKDLTKAEIFLSAEKNSANLLEKIKKDTWKISKQIFPRLFLKKIPILIFSLYKEKNYQKVLNILDQLSS